MAYVVNIENVFSLLCQYQNLFLFIIIMLDINECNNLDICGPGSCINNDGSYTCTCDEGYAFDQSTCTGKMHIYVINISLQHYILSIF